MQTIVKKEDLETIFNISSDSIVYKANSFIFDSDKLTNYLNNPQKYDLLKNSKKEEDNFYKNLALYIINSDNSAKFIKLDLEQQFIVTQGLFELVKNFYEDSPYFHLSLDRNVNNDLFIKTKKLKEFDKNNHIDMAKDVELSGRSIVIDETSKIIENNNFFWKSEDLKEKNGTNQEDYLIGKLVAIAEKIIYSTDNHSRDELQDIEFYNVIKNADQTLVQSEKFKLALLSQDNQYVNNVLIHDTHPDIFSIDFKSKFAHKYIKKQLKNNNILLLAKIFEQNIYAKEKNSYGWMREAIEDKKMQKYATHNLDFYDLINEPNVIDYLLHRRGSGLTFSGDAKDFSIVSAYSYLNDENSSRKDIVIHFIDSIVTDKYNDRFSSRQFSRLPLPLYNEEWFLNRTLKYIDFADMKKNIDSPYNKFVPILLTDKQFILNSLETIKNDNLCSWIVNFIPKTEINKEFLSAIIEKRPGFYYTLSNNQTLKSFGTDADLLFLSAKKHFNTSHIPKNFMKTLLLQNHLPEQEEIKVRWLIEDRNFEPSSQMYKKLEDRKIYEEKFLRPEYVYLQKKDGFGSHWLDTSKIQKRLTSVPEVLDILNKIESFAVKYNYEFNIDKFYTELPKNLQSKQDIVLKLLELDHEPFGFEKLSPTLQFNKNIALKFIEGNVKNTLHVPQEFFSDIEFSLAFAKLMDDGIFNNQESLIPSFITKFFDTQEVTEKYYDHLSTYINYFKIKNIVDEKPAKQLKKNKI